MINPTKGHVAEWYQPVDLHNWVESALPVEHPVLRHLHLQLCLLYFTYARELLLILDINEEDDVGLLFDRVENLSHLLGEILGESYLLDRQGPHQAVIVGDPEEEELRLLIDSLL